MIVKSPPMLQASNQRIDETILDNKILIVCIGEQENGLSCSGYAISIRKMQEYVESVRDEKPDSVEQLVRWYGMDELQLSNSQFVEVFADQETAERLTEKYCDMSNESEYGSFDWFRYMTVGNYLDMLYKQLPEKVSYLY